VDLADLEALLGTEGFGAGGTSVGAELEFSLVDDAGDPHCLGPILKRESTDPRLQLELNQFNLEINFDPTPAAGTPFTLLERDITDSIRDLNERAAVRGGRIVPIGILPTLQEQHLTSEAMCDLDRYHALSAGLRRERAGKFDIRIDGEDPLDISCDDVTREGAATSLQIHLRVAPSDFVNFFNACQIATAAALAISGNSPLFLGHRLWDETRVALFKQAVDSRVPNTGSWRRPPRVGFGQGWLRRSAYELFAENAALFPVLLPVRLDRETHPGPPPLDALRLHQGTVWQWNRGIYDPSGGGHLRIEMRALPSGPTPEDMMANAAFLIGLTVGLGSEIEELLPAFPFRYAEYNFYRAAQQGLDARLLWPSSKGISPRETTVPDLIPGLLPIAERGLDEIGVDSSESARVLGVISARLESGQTGARWQRGMLARLETGETRQGSLHRLLERYLEEYGRGVPVAEWSLEA
jgi:hypothetical protein